MKATAELLANKTDAKQIAMLSAMQVSEGGLSECQGAALKSKQSSVNAKGTSDLLANRTEDDQIALLSFMQDTQGGLTECQEAVLNSQRAEEGAQPGKSKRGKTSTFTNVERKDQPFFE